MEFALSLKCTRFDQSDGSNYYHMLPLDFDVPPQTVQMGTCSEISRHARIFSRIVDAAISALDNAICQSWRRDAHVSFRFGQGGALRCVVAAHGKEALAQLSNLDG